MDGQKGGLDRDSLFGLSAILLWSTSVALARSIAEQVGPLTAGAAVYLTGGIILGSHFFFRKRSLRRLLGLPRLYLFGCGALFVTYTVALYLALGLAADRSQTLEVGLVNYLWPALTIVFSLVLLSQKAKAGLLPATGIALGGVFLVLTQGTTISWDSFLRNLASNPSAYCLALIAAVSWALYSNLSRRWAGKSLGGAVPLFILVTGMVLLLFRLFHREDASYSIRLVLEVICLSLATALGYLFWDRAMRKGDVVLVAAFSYLTPFFSTVASCIYLRVVPGARLWVGCILIVAGSFLSWRSIEHRSG